MIVHVEPGRPWRHQDISMGRLQNSKVAGMVKCELVIGELGTDESCQGPSPPPGGELRKQQDNGNDVKAQSNHC